MKKSNFLTRTLTGAVIVALVVGFFFLRLIDVNLFMIPVGFLAVFGTGEIAFWFFIKKPVKTEEGLSFEYSDGAERLEFFLTVLSALSLAPLYYFWGTTVLFAVIPAEIIVALFIGLFAKKQGIFYLKAVITAVYPKLLLCFLFIANALGEKSLTALLLIFTVSPATDVFAYLVGSLIGGKKLCPKVSPNKTISGAIGGLLGGIAVAGILFLILKPEVNIFLFLAVGLVASVLTQAGDLLESVIKRKLGIKDFGKIFPGHGGVLDRIDGMSVAGVFITVVFLFI